MEVGSWGAAHPDEYEENKGNPLPDDPQDTGQDNAIYGNRFLNNGGIAIQHPMVDEITDGFSSDAQEIIYGNEYNDETHGNPAKPCPDSVLETDTIGHLGGDSPWT